MTLTQPNDPAREKLYADLVAYCTRDSRAIAAIHRSILAIFCTVQHSALYPTDPRGHYSTCRVKLKSTLSYSTGADIERGVHGDL